MAKKIQPMFNGVLLKALDSETKSPGGIHLPSSAKRAYKHAVVHAMGPGRTLVSGDIVRAGLVVGNEVLIQSAAGLEVEHEGEKFILVADDAILAVLAEDSPE